MDRIVGTIDDVSPGLQKKWIADLGLGRKDLAILLCLYENTSAIQEDDWRIMRPVGVDFTDEVHLTVEYIREFFEKEGGNYSCEVDGRIENTQILRRVSFKGLMSKKRFEKTATPERFPGQDVLSPEFAAIQHEKAMKANSPIEFNTLIVRDTINHLGIHTSESYMRKTFNNPKAMPKMLCCITL